MTYDFMTLSPQDFEALANDLLSIELAVPLQQFKAGKDGGVDLKFALTDAGKDDLVVQCKRYATGAVAALLRSLAEEARKLVKIRPSRYVVATTVGLSNANKQKIQEVLKPWILSTNDIYGADDLNRLLRANPTIEQRHFKLWISSVAVLQRVLHSQIFAQTEASLDEIRRRASRLVVHDGFNRALSSLNDRHHVMIVGNPGVGKSTLARLLLIHHLREDYEPIWVTSNIEEAWKLVREVTKARRKCIIVYDDFLGRLSFGDNKFAKNEDVSLLRLVDEVAATKGVRLIFTTREYILEEAKQRHGYFDERANELLKFTLAVGDYTRPQRAKILFNHLYFSDLPDSRLEKLVAAKAYQQVLASDIFNPRVIETVCLASNSKSLNDDEFLKYFKNEFKNPASLWRHPYKTEISEVAKSILLVLWTFQGRARVDSVRAVVQRLHTNGSAIAFEGAFEDAIRQIDGSFTITERLRVWRGTEAVETICFHNPSVEEFMRNEGASHEVLKALVPEFTHIDQVQTVFEAIVGRKDMAAMLGAVREAAERCFGKASGKIINGIEHGELKSSRRWDEQGISQIDCVRLLLEIEVAYGVADARNQELFGRVSGWGFWAEFVVEALQDEEVAHDIESFANWLSSLEYPIGYPSREALKECIFDFMRPNFELESMYGIRLEARPRGLACLILALRTLGELSSSEMEVCLLACEEAVQNVLEHEEDVGWIEEEIYAIRRLRTVSSSFARLDDAIDDLEGHADQIREGRENDSGNDYVKSSYASTDLFDEEGLFESLLDR